MNHEKECNSCIHKIGWNGESIIRKYLSDTRRKYMQADLVLKGKNGDWFLAEVKCQERYNPPPFEGHGLPEWQIIRRLEFQEDTGIWALLFVVEKGTGLIFWNYIKRLWSGEKYKTSGSKPRVIFPLKNFNILSV